MEAGRGEQAAGDKNEPKRQDARRQSRQDEGGDQPSAVQESAPSAARSSQARPGRPRPLRPSQFRMVSLAGPGQQRVPIIEASPQALAGVPIEAQIELASGVLQPAGRVTMVPPKRPNFPPSARNFAGDTVPAAAYAVHHHHHRAFQPTTSLGATALTSGSSQKPNRYSWAQMQQWHAAQSAAAAAAAAADATGEAAAATTSGGFHYHLPAPFSSAASRVLVVPNPIVNLSEHTKSRLIKFIEAIKRFSEKWFSHVLLLLFLASYACFGAYIFISFEAPNEQWEKQLIIDTRLRIVNESYEQARELGSRELFVEAFRARFEEYERLLNRACASGMTSSSLDNQWTFWGALFYSMTVFTTIGYGHLTPVTFAGRVATMIYAIFGIPILLMVLADLGKLLTRIIKYAFKKFRCMYNKLLGRKASVRTRKLITDNTNQYIGQARHAFERGFATYIQPYQSRFPNSFLRDFRKSGEHSAPPQQQQQQQQQVPADLPGQFAELSDVIITPANQSEPVSPQIDDESAPERPKLMTQEQEGKPEKQQPSPPQTIKQQKEKSKRSRKVSTSHKPGQEATSPRRASQKQTVQRSSSATNVDSTKTPAAVPPQPGTGKRSSFDQHLASGEPTSPPGGSQDKLPSGAGSAAFVASERGAQDDLEALQQEHDEGFADELDDDLDIPVSFALFLLITYMMFGAVVFSIWESWNFFDSLYFVFISMSTIGFGDLVPQHPKRMIGTFAYLLFGLALTSMCINVVQEKIHATFLRAKMQIGEKMGFDLDQIMADDYYHEGGSAFGDESEAQLDESGSYANSLVLSRNNSGATGEQLGQPPPSEPLTAGSQQGAGAATGQTSGEPLPAAPISRSKSKESLKWKKRSLSGANSSGATLSAGEQHPAGSSGKRKTSGGSKRALPASLSRGQQHNQAQQPRQAAEVKPEERHVASAIKHQVETIRMLNVPVMMQQFEERAGPSPSINQPIDGGVRAYCEPLRRAFQAGQRPKLVATRSQPSPAYQPNGSHHNKPAQSGPRSTSGTLTPRNSHRGRPSELGNGPNGRRSADNVTRSLTATRRASVSDELNQLDDLIVALSKSPPERFGPLLGIPSNRSSRSNSPANQFAAATPPRRGTSLMVRGSSESVGERRGLGRLSHERQRSANNSTTQTPPFLTPSGSNNLLSAGDQRQADKRRKSSGSSSLASRLAMVSAQQSADELNLGESQAALDELEAVRFSAV